MAINPQERFKAHMNPSSGCLALAGAVKKYGVESFTLEVLCQGTDEYITELEVKAIKAYNTQVPHGYNILVGGLGGQKLYWQEEWNCLLGTKPDYILARELGTTTGVVQLRRSGLNITSKLFRDKEIFLEKYKSKLGVMLDKELAELAGIGLTTVRTYRYELSIPAVYQPPCYEDMFNLADGELLGEIPTTEFARLTSISRDFLEKKHKQLGVPTFYEKLKSLKPKEKNMLMMTAEGLAGRRLFRYYITPKGVFLSLDYVKSLFQQYKPARFNYMFSSESYGDWGFINV